MDKNIVLRVENVSKKFNKSLKDVVINGAADITRDFLGLQTNSAELRKGEFWAVKDLNLELKRGQSLGLIGSNGSGKSTTLKMINGIFMPDNGRITVTGRVGALIEVGAGFHPMLTGRENIYVNGAILGMSKKELDKKFDEIVEFAEIEDFIDSPVKHYSSGMYVRLGFAIAVQSTPDILLIDEVLAVGDYNFQMKCLNKIKQLKRDGVSIIFVSHSEAAVRSVCDHGVLIDKGSQIYIGSISEVMSEYQKCQNRKIEQQVTTFENSSIYTQERRGIGKARFQEVKITDLSGNVLRSIVFGTDKIRVCAKYIAFERIEKPRFMAFLRDANKNEHVFALGVSSLGVEEIDYIEGEGEIEFFINVNNLGPNLYGLNIGIADSVMLNLAYDYWDINGIFLEVEPTSEMQNDIAVSKPFIIPQYAFIHRKF